MKKAARNRLLLMQALKRSFEEKRQRDQRVRERGLKSKKFNHSIPSPSSAASNLEDKPDCPTKEICRDLEEMDKPLNAPSAPSDEAKHPLEICQKANSKEGAHSGGAIDSDKLLPECNQESKDFNEVDNTILAGNSSDITDLQMSQPISLKRLSNDLATPSQEESSSSISDNITEDTTARIHDEKTCSEESKIDGQIL